MCIVGHGQVVLLLLNARKAPQLVDVDHVGITLQSCCAVALSAGIVVEIILGHPTEEPWLVEIGLGRNGLIEVLDREDVILVIKGRTPDGDEPVSVELGPGGKE